MGLRIPVNYRRLCQVRILLFVLLFLFQFLLPEWWRVSFSSGPNLVGPRRRSAPAGGGATPSGKHLTVISQFLHNPLIDFVEVDDLINKPTVDETTVF